MVVVTQMLKSILSIFCELAILHALFFFTGDGMDGMKSSPANGPGTPRDDMPPNGGPGSEMGGYNPYQDNVPQPPVNVRIKYFVSNTTLE